MGEMIQFVIMLSVMSSEVKTSTIRIAFENCISSGVALWSAKIGIGRSYFLS